MAAPASFAGTVGDAGFDHQPLADADPTELGAVFGRVAALSTQEADDLVVQEVFGRLNRDAALPAMRAALSDWRPDAVLREPAELASYIAAAECGVPHVQTNIGLGSVDDRLMPLYDAPLAEVGRSTAGLLAAPSWTVVPPSFDVARTTGTGTVAHTRDPVPDAVAEAPLPDSAAPGRSPPRSMLCRTPTRACRRSTPRAAEHVPDRVERPLQGPRRGWPVRSGGAPASRGTLGERY